MPEPFLILSLPRSRSAWLSQWLSTAVSACEHDASCRAADWVDFHRVVCSSGRPYVGAADTGLSVGWAAEVAFDGPVVVVERPINEVIPATRAAFPEMPLDTIERLVTLGAAGLEQARGQAALWVHYKDLSRPAVAAAVWATCLPAVAFDLARWRRWSDFRVTVDPGRYVRNITPAGAAWLRDRVTAAENPRRGDTWQH